MQKSYYSQKKLWRVKTILRKNNAAGITLCISIYITKLMATHSSVFALRIPGTGELGGLPSIGVAQSQTQLKWLSSSSIAFKTDTSDKWNRIGSPDLSPSICCQLIFDKGAKNTERAKVSLFNEWCWGNYRRLYAEEWNWTLNLHHSQKLTQNGSRT